MAEQKFYIDMSELSGGVRQDVPNEQMPDNSFYTMENFEYDMDGSVKSRGGQTIWNATTVAGIFQNGTRFYRPSTSTTTTIVAANLTTSNALYAGNDSAGTFTQITGGTGLGAGLTPDFIPFRDYLFIVNGTQAMQVYQTGTTKADCVFSAASPKCKYGAVADYRLWLAGDPNAPNRIYVSDLGLFQTAPTADCMFSTNSFIDIAGQTNDKITGIVSFLDEIYVFRNKDVYRVTGVDPDTWAMVRVIDTAGAVGQKAITVTPYGMLFASEQTIWWYSPQTGARPVDVGKKIQTILGSAILTDAVCGHYSVKNLAYCSFRANSAAVNNYAMVFDYMSGSVWTSTNFGAAAFIDYNGVGDTNVFHRLAPDTTGTSKGVMFVTDTGNQDAGSNYTCMLKTKHFSGRDKHTQSRARQLWMTLNADIESGAMSVTASTNRGAGDIVLGTLQLAGFSQWGTFVWGVDYWGGGEYQYGTLPFPMFANFREIQLQFSKTDANSLKLYSYKLEYRTRPLRRR